MTTKQIPVGANGEKATVNYLKQIGYSVVARNYHSRFGEVDIIARKDSFLCFVEVKARSKPSLAHGREYVTELKQQRIIKTAEVFIAKNRQYQDLQPRFDCAEVNFFDDTIDIKYFENAF